MTFIIDTTMMYVDEDSEMNHGPSTANASSATMKIP